MNKYDFLRKLDRELSPLDQEERKELLAFYEERFYNGTIYENKTEEQVIAELESPEQIARNILIEYGISPRAVKARKSYINKEKINEVVNGTVTKVSDRFKDTPFNSAELVVLILVDLFILSWLIPTLFSVVVSLGGSLLSYVGVITLLFGQTTVYDQHMFMFATGVYIFLFLFTLVILELFLWVCKKTVLYHLRVFKYKKYADVNKRLSKVSVEGWFKRHRLLRFIKNISGLVAVVMIFVSGVFLFTHYGEIEELYINQEVLTEVSTIDNLTTIEEYNIFVDLDDMDVEFVSTTGTDIVITRTHSEDLDGETYSVTETTDGFVVLHELPRTFWNFGFSLENLSQLFNRDEVVIQVPEGVVLHVIDVNTTNGKVDLNDVSALNIAVNTSNGEISVENVVVEDDLDLRTTNGVIRITNAEATLGGTITAITSNGKIIVNGASFNAINLDTSNGRINVSNVNLDKRTGTTLYADTSNGSIELDEVYVSVVDLDTSNGDIAYNNTDQVYDVDLTTDTSNGNITGNVN